MREWWTPALGIARRNVRRTVKNPALWLPMLIFPSLLFAAFAGGLSTLEDSPRFGYPDYTTFQFVWIMVQASMVAGHLTGVAIAEDFERGFAKRMMLSTRSRTPILVGYMLATIVRGIAILAFLFAVGLIAGMEVSGSAIEIAATVGLGLTYSVVMALWSSGLAFRARSPAAAPAAMMPAFILLFLVPVYTPRQQLADWLQAIANWNPLTALLEAGRGLMVGEPVSVGLAYGVLVGLALPLFVWAVTGLRAAEAAGGMRK